jgi:hypothetical protein
MNSPLPGPAKPSNPRTAFRRQRNAAAAQQTPQNENICISLFFQASSPGMSAFKFSMLNKIRGAPQGSAKPLQIKRLPWLSTDLHFSA